MLILCRAFSMPTLAPERALSPRGPGPRRLALRRLGEPRGLAPPRGAQAGGVQVRGERSTSGEDIDTFFSAKFYIRELSE